MEKRKKIMLEQAQSACHQSLQWPLLWLSNFPFGNWHSGGVYSVRLPAVCAEQEHTHTHTHSWAHYRPSVIKRSYFIPSFFLMLAFEGIREVSVHVCLVGNASERLQTPSRLPSISICLLSAMSGTKPRLHLQALAQLIRRSQSQPYSLSAAPTTDPSTRTHTHAHTTNYLSGNL